jgi:hypothetical protein
MRGEPRVPVHRVERTSGLDGTLWLPRTLESG